MVDASISQQITFLLNRKLPSIDLKEINSLCQEFPCFSSAFLLKAVYENQLDKETFETNLSGIAVRVNNRSVLYDHVHNDFELEKNKVLSLEVDPEILNQEDQELEDLLQSAAHLKTTHPPKEEVPPIFEEKINLKDLAASINKKTNKKKKKDSEEPIIKEEKQIVSKAKTKKIVKKKVVKKKDLPKEKQPKSFTDWLKNKKSIEKEKLVIGKEITLPKAEEIPLDLAVSNEAELILEAKKSPLKLEDFIVNQIEIKQNRKEHLSSSFTHAISETYAKILSNQGKNSEAISIYKELSIKYPEKSSNFARQIEKLKNSN